MAKWTKQSKPKTPAAIGLFRRTLTRVRLIIYSSSTRTIAFINLLTGFIFGVSVAVGLGLNAPACLIFGTLAAFSVLAFGSLVTYLLTQAIVVASLAVVSQLAFRLIPEFRIEAELFQVCYLLILTLTPLLAFVKKIRVASALLPLSHAVQFVTAGLFAGLVQFLRSRMKLDAEFAFSAMYEGEDNAGIVEALSGSLKNGFTPQAAQFGEFVNSIYLAVAGLITQFSDSNNPGLLPVLTHYNITLLLMAWVPIVGLFVLVLSGRKLKDTAAIAIVCVVSAVLGILFWPFVTLGHTSVISSGLFAASLLALTINNRLATHHPVFFASLVTSFGVIIGTSWFPLMPFAAATLVLTYFALGRLEYKKGNVKITSFLLVTFIALSAVLLPEVLQLAVNSGNYLELQGGTRTPSFGLVLISLALLSMTIWRFAPPSSEKGPTFSKLFIFTVLILIASNVYLLISALAGNAGTFGYGATKYLLTTVAFSIPVFWVLFVGSLKTIDSKNISAVGLVLILAILMLQPDSRKVPASIVAPQLTSWQFLAPPESIVNDPQTLGIVSAVNTALKAEPDHIFCVSDYGTTGTYWEPNFPSYFCNRWVASLMQDNEPYKWGSIALGIQAKETLEDLQKKYSSEEVVIIHISSPTGTNANPTDISETWWGKYVDKSWKIMSVK